LEIIEIFNKPILDIIEIFNKPILDGPIWVNIEILDYVEILYEPISKKVI